MPETTVETPTEEKPKRKWKLKLFCLGLAFVAGVATGTSIASDPSQYGSGSH